MIRQPKGSKLCAQACVASLRGTSLQEAVRLCGEEEMLAMGLVGALRGVRSNWSLLCISHPKWDHWLLKNRAQFWSPAIGHFVDPPQWVLDSHVTEEIALCGI